MKYPLVTDENYQPKQYRRTGAYNPHRFTIGTISDEQCRTVIQRMQTGAPGMHHMLHTDPFVKALIDHFDADIVIYKKAKQQ